MVSVADSGRSVAGAAALWFGTLSGVCRAAAGRVGRCTHFACCRQALTSLGLQALRAPLLHTRQPQLATALLQQLQPGAATEHATQLPRVDGLLPPDVGCSVIAYVVQRVDSWWMLNRTLEFDGSCCR